jgi:hypothetical protein
MLMPASDRFSVQGYVSPGFEAVREAFAENFAQRRELGGACCAYHRGLKVVDLWGGVRNKKTGEAWERDTMVVVQQRRRWPFSVALRSVSRPRASW